MAKKARVTRERQVRLFENPVLEWLTRVHPAVPIMIWGPVSVALVWLGLRSELGGWTVAGLTIAGLFTWTFVEYCLHRWVFHWEPSNEKLREWFYPVHQLHHEVQEYDRLLAPPMMAVPIWMVLLGIAYWLLGTPLVFPFFGGFNIGYLAYDYIHFYTHFARPKTAIGQSLRRRHLQHHFACEDRWYGVSSPLWDYVFRTHVPKGRPPSHLASD